MSADSFDWVVVFRGQLASSSTARHVPELTKGCKLALAPIESIFRRLGEAQSVLSCGRWRQFTNRHSSWRAANNDCSYQWHHVDVILHRLRQARLAFSSKNIGLPAHPTLPAIIVNTEKPVIGLGAVNVVANLSGAAYLTTTHSQPPIDGIPLRDYSVFRQHLLPPGFAPFWLSSRRPLRGIVTDLLEQQMFSCVQTIFFSC